MGTALARARAKTSDVNTVRVVPASAVHAPLLAALFERAGVACHCRYFHFRDVTNAWLDRCAHHPDRNRAEMFSALRDANDEMSGVVALDEAGAVGWLKVAPANSLPKLYEQRIYRRLPCFDGDRAGVFAVGCLLVDPGARRRGTARALLEGAIALVKDRGGGAIEAFPRRGDGLRDDEAWTGPFALFTQLGFQVVHDFAPYPVLRLKMR